MAKLYTIKEMAELLNAEFGDNPANYEFTEERVRARIRSARARGTIKPTRMGYDRRTNFYTEEDFERLKASWIGPELPEFTEYPEDIEVINPDEGEVTVRPAKGTDAEAILNLIPAPRSDDEKDALGNYASKMLKSNQYANFVAVLNEDKIIGWAQAEIPAAICLIKGKVTGVIRIFVPPEGEANPIAVRSLFHRASQWLIGLSVHSWLVEMPTSLSDLHEMFASRMYLKPETSLLLMEKQEG